MNIKGLINRLKWTVHGSNMDAYDQIQNMDIGDIIGLVKEQRLLIKIQEFIAIYRGRKTHIVLCKDKSTTEIVAYIFILDKPDEVSNVNTDSEFYHLNENHFKLNADEGIIMIDKKTQDLYIATSIDQYGITIKLATDNPREPLVTGFKGYSYYEAGDKLMILLKK